jgi:hypothetical protein
MDNLNLFETVSFDIEQSFDGILAMKKHIYRLRSYAGMSQQADKFNIEWLAQILNTQPALITSVNSAIGAVEGLVNHYKLENESLKDQQTKSEKLAGENLEQAVKYGRSLEKMLEKLDLERVVEVIKNGIETERPFETIVNVATSTMNTVIKAREELNKNAETTKHYQDKSIFLSTALLELLEEIGTEGQSLGSLVNDGLDEKEAYRSLCGAALENLAKLKKAYTNNTDNNRLNSNRLNSDKPNPRAFEAEALSSSSNLPEPYQPEKAFTRTPHISNCVFFTGLKQVINPDTREEATIDGYLVGQRLVIHPCRLFLHLEKENSDLDIDLDQTYYVVSEYEDAIIKDRFFKGLFSSAESAHEHLIRTEKASGMDMGVGLKRLKNYLQSMSSDVKKDRLYSVFLDAGVDLNGECSLENLYKKPEPKKKKAPPKKILPFDNFTQPNNEIRLNTGGFMPYTPVVECFSKGGLAVHRRLDKVLKVTPGKEQYELSPDVFVVSHCESGKKVLNQDFDSPQAAFEALEAFYTKFWQLDWFKPEHKVMEDIHACDLMESLREYIGKPEGNDNKGSIKHVSL